MRCSTRYRISHWNGEADTVGKQEMTREGKRGYKRIRVPGGITHSPRKRV